MGRIKQAVKSYINGDTFAAFGNNLVSLIKGPLVTILVAIYIGEAGQGYWYTFGSVAALSVFADLGFATIVGQFAAHEFSHLSFDSKMRFAGPDESIDRISALYKFILKWSATVVMVAYPIIMVVGFVMLGKYDNDVNWQLPWVIYALTSGVSFLLSINSNFFTGCGQIKKTQIRNMASTATVGVVTIIGLVLDWQLYSLAIGALSGILVGVVLQFAFFGRAILQLVKKKQEIKYPWGKSFLRLIWKYALSWCSGYFIFQIYTPLAFLVYDPVLAGKVGITMTMCQACFSIANTLFFVVTPKINMAVSERNWAKGRHLTKTGMISSCLLFMLGATAILLGIGLFQALDTPLRAVVSRFLPVGAAAFLLAAWLSQIPINAIATYGRAYKQEPFMAMSLIGAAFIVLSTVVIVFTLPIEFLFMGFALCNLVSIGIFYGIFRRGETTWQNKLIAMQDAEYHLIEEQREHLHQQPTVKAAASDSDESKGENQS